MDKTLRRWRRWRLKNTFLLLVGIFVFYWLAKTPAVSEFIQHLGYLGYLGAFLAGFFFVSTYTVVPAGYVLFQLAKYNSAFEVAAFAGLGAMLGDYVIFRFIKDQVMAELKPYLAKLGNRSVRRLFATPYFLWLVPVIGAVIIASPLPDELGVSLIGASRMSPRAFLILSYLLNTAGIFVIVVAAQRLG